MRKEVKVDQKLMEQRTHQRENQQSQKSVLQNATKLPARFFKKKKKKNTNNIRNGKGAITTDPKEMKKL